LTIGQSLNSTKYNATASIRKQTVTANVTSAHDVTRVAYTTSSPKQRLLIRVKRCMQDKLVRLLKSKKQLYITTCL